MRVDRSHFRVVVGTAVALVLIVLGAVYLQFYGVPIAIGHLFNRRVTQPTDEEYRVYSGFIDEYFSPDGPSRVVELEQRHTLAVAAETMKHDTPVSEYGYGMVFFRRPEMADDFNQQNRQSWLLQPRFSARFNISIVGRVAVPKGSGLLHLSRAGFDVTRRFAVVQYWYACGPTCGAAGVVVLGKRPGGWHIEEWGPGVIF